MVKHLYKEKFFEFIKKHNQHMFFITSEVISVLAVVNDEKHSINLFESNDGFLTCNSLVYGDFRGLNVYGTNYLAIEELSTEEKEQILGLEDFLEKHKHFSREDKTVCYYSCKNGQGRSPISQEDGFIIEQVLAYFITIMHLYEQDQINNPSDKDCIAVFDFNNEKGLYNSTFSEVGSFDFLPKLNFRFRRNKAIVKALSDRIVIPGTTHIGTYYSSFVLEEYEYQNNFTQELLPIVLYAGNDQGDFNYVIFCSAFMERRKNALFHLESLLSQIELTDVMITNNYFIYVLLVKSLDELGIKLIFEPQDNHFLLITELLIAGLFSEANYELLSILLRKIRESYGKLLEIIENNGDINDASSALFDTVADEYNVNRDQAEQVFVDYDYDDEDEDFDEEEADDFFNDSVDTTKIC